MNTEPKYDDTRYSSIEELLDSYKDAEPEYITVGPTVGIDCWFLTAGVNNGYITVEEVGDTGQKIIGIQGNAELRISRFISIKCCLIGEADDIDVRDELEIFDKAKDRGGFRELSCKDSFGYYATPNTIMSEAASNQGLYYLYDGDELIDKQYVMSIVGVGELDWLKKIGIPDIDLKAAVLIQMNTFEDELSFAGGVKFTLAGKPAFSAVISVGFKKHELDSIAFAIKGEINLGGIVLTAAGFGLSGMASNDPNTISVEVGLAFGGKVELPSKVAKLLDTNEKMFLVEVVGNGEVTTDFNNFYISVQGNVLGFIEIKGYYRYSNGDHHDVGLSVGTVKSSSFRFRVAGDVGWDKDSLSVKIALEGNYKTDFSVKAFGETWEFAALDVGGGVTFDYNSKTKPISETVSCKESSLSISLYGHANVKILFVKFGVEVSKNWFIKYKPEYSYSSAVRAVLPVDEDESEYVECRNLELQSLKREDLSSMPSLPSGVRGEFEARYDETISTDEFPRELLEELCLEINGDCEGKAIEIMVAAQYTLKDCYWEIITDGAVYTSDDDLSDGPVTVTEINHSQYQLSVANPQAGPWIIDIYGSKDWNGAILMNAELANPVETSLALDEVRTEKKDIVIYEYDDDGSIKIDEDGNHVIDDSYVGNVTQVTFTYQAHAEGSDTLVLLCMEEAGSQAHEGVVLSMLEATTGDETKTVTIEIPYDIQGGQYAFYIKAMSSDWNGAAYSQYTDAVQVVPQTARLYAEGLAVTGNAAEPGKYTAAFTLVNDGSENVTDAHVELIFDNPESDSVIVLADETVSLAAGASNELSYDIILPVGMDTAKGRLSLRLDAEDNVEEGIFDGDADAGQLVSTARILATDDDVEGSTLIHWETIAGATSYTLKYALNQDWDNSVSIEGLTGNNARLQLAAGRYFYNIVAFDEFGNEIGDKDSGKFDVDSRNELQFSGRGDIARTEEFYLYNGLYSLENLNLGGFTGTLAIHQVYNEEDEAIATLQVADGQLSSLKPFALGNGRYFLTATPADVASDTDALSLTMKGALIADNNSQRVQVCISDALNENGEYFETVSSSIGGNATDDIWDYSLNQGGLLTLYVTTTEGMNSALIFNLYVKSEDENAEEDYVLASSITVDRATDDIILTKYSVINNFYIEVCSEDGEDVLEHTDYTMSVFFDAFHADVNDDAVMDTDTDGTMQVSGWIGYADASDTFLLSIGENDGGVYTISLAGEQGAAGLYFYSTSGELLASADIGDGGKASLENIDLYAGNYFIDIVSLDEGQGACNTDFLLSVTPEQLFAYMDSETACCIIDQNESFLMGLYIEADGQYDISQLETAHNAKIYNVLNTGELEELHTENGQLELLKDCTYYLDVDYLNRAGTVSIDQDGMTLNWENFIGLKSEEVSGNTQGIAWDNQLSEGNDTLVIKIQDRVFAVRLDGEKGQASVLGLAEDANCSILTVSDGQDYCSDDAALSATNTADKSVLLQGEDKEANIFFATSKGTWGSHFEAYHTSMGFTAALAGKDKIIDIFSGSGANNVVLLGDSEKGAALFVDDIYSESPDKLAQLQSRLNGLTEIVGGNGDDVIDMTSARFTYQGEGLAIYGGDGNDVIWAGHGDNSLFGDAGDDMLVGAEGNDLLVGGRGDDDIYGGGGNDICVFSGEWGHDSVTQTADGTLVLCFVDGTADAWDAQELRYDDGSNSLQVVGVSIDKITVNFKHDAMAYLLAGGYAC